MYATYAIRIKIVVIAKIAQQNHYTVYLSKSIGQDAVKAFNTGIATVTRAIIRRCRYNLPTPLHLSVCVFACFQFHFHAPPNRHRSTTPILISRSQIKRARQNANAAHAARWSGQHKTAPRGRTRVCESCTNCRTICVCVCSRARGLGPSIHRTHCPIRVHVHMWFTMSMCACVRVCVVANTRTTYADVHVFTSSVCAHA